MPEWITPLLWPVCPVSDAGVTLQHDHPKAGLAPEHRPRGRQSDNARADDHEIEAIVHDGRLPFAEHWNSDATQTSWTCVLPSTLPASGPRMAAAFPEPRCVRMKCHEVDYDIIGDDLQMVEIELDPAETVIAEAGSMNYMEDGIGFEAKMGDGSQPDKGFLGKMLDVGKRALTGESLFMTHFTNQGEGKKRVAFAAPYPGKIIPIDMEQDPGTGESYCQKDAFLVRRAGHARSGSHSRRSWAPASLAARASSLQRLTGRRPGLSSRRGHDHPEGSARRNAARRHRLHRRFQPRHRLRHPARGQSQEHVLRRRRTFPGHFARHRAGLACRALPFSRLADRVIAHAPSAGGSSKGEGSILGGIGNMFEQ